MTKGTDPQSIVRFGLNNETYEVEYDRTKLKLGAIVHVTEQPIGPSFSDRPGQTSVPHTVMWIAHSQWYVELSKGLQVDDNHIARILKAASGLVSEDASREAYAYCCSRVPLERQYLDNVLEKCGLAQIMSVVERLELVDRLHDEDVGKRLFVHWEPLVTHLMLTCFDRLGQPVSWLDFPAWLSKLEPNYGGSSTEECVEAARRLYLEWQAIYGVRTAFNNFLTKVLPRVSLNSLLFSFDLHTSNFPLDGHLVPATNDQKLRYLYELRNRYTHEGDYIGGVHPRIMATPDKIGWTTHRKQTILGDKLVTLETRNWPEIFVSTVRIGLAATIRNISKQNRPPKEL